MTGKIEIVRHLGDEALLLPALLADALVANDRLKLSLTLLQEAAAHSEHPERPLRNFDSEIRAVGLANSQFGSTISGARILSADRILVPGAKALITTIAADLSAMLAPLNAAASEETESLQKRLAAILAGLPVAEEDEMLLRDIDAMTAARRNGPDGVHLLVMDAHKAINRLASETAVETIDGACVHHLEQRDRVSVKAFMAGLNRTAVLSFGHPGLGTTAARTGARLTIQNDIGTTDAHVLVIHVEDNDVTVTYTDVHRARAKFFISLFAAHNASWTPLSEGNAERVGHGEAFYLVTGHFTAGDQTELHRFLDFLGSRIVFLIDWNKARKALQAFVKKDSAIDVLKWASLNDFGHRAFLELGGTDLIFEAIRRSADGRIPYGARLDETVGTSETADFLRRVLRLTSEGLRAGRSTRLIRDEVQADLAQMFDTAESAVLAVLVRHLGVTRMLAASIADVFVGDRVVSGFDGGGLKDRAKRLEEKGDRLTVHAREICARLHGANDLRQTVDEVENATDSLDESAFLLSLMPPAENRASVAALSTLAGVVVESISHMVRSVEAVMHLPQGRRSDATDSLQSIDAVITAERSADIAQRDAFSAFMSAPDADARVPVLGLQVARMLETATDHLAHAALSLRARVLEELSA